jgi:hypothetical protein
VPWDGPPTAKNLHALADVFQARLRDGKFEAEENKYFAVRATVSDNAMQRHVGNPLLPSEPMRRNDGRWFSVPVVNAEML